MTEAIERSSGEPKIRIGQVEAFIAQSSSHTITDAPPNLTADEVALAIVGGGALLIEEVRPLVGSLSKIQRGVNRVIAAITTLHLPII